MRRQAFATAAQCAYPIKFHAQLSHLGLEQIFQNRPVMPFDIALPCKESAGPRAAVLYTVLAGAKRHRLEPWTYVRELLLRMHSQDVQLEAMLTDRWAAEHPEAV